MQLFFRNYTYILTRTHGEKSEDMFLVKIANKGTSLIICINVAENSTLCFFVKTM